MRLRAWAAALALVAVLLTGCGSEPPAAEAAATPAVTASPTPAPTEEPKAVTTTLRLSATGDNLIHSSIYKQAARRAGGDASQGNGSYDFRYCYENMLDFYAGYDINWINQETLVNDRLSPSDYPCFSTPGDVGRTLYDVGFRIFSLANNHTYDRGAAGIAATREFWAAMPQDVLTTGLYAGEADYSSIPIQEIQGVRIAYLAYTQYTNGIPTPSGAEANIIYTEQTDVIKQQIELAREQADLVIVGNHWGIEDSHVVTDAQRELAQMQADWGADLIIGTHPHVVQDAEWLTSADDRPVFVAYSLGNFISAQSRPDEMFGLILDVQIEHTDYPDGTSSTVLHSPVLHPVVNHYESGYSNIRAYLLRDYPAELADAHGVRGANPQFGLEYIKQVLNEWVSEEFLVM